MFITVGLELAFGLRAGEVTQIRRGMIVSERGRPLLDSRKVNVKSGLGTIVVPPLDPFWSCFVARIKREGWTWQPDDLLVPGTPTEIDDLFRSIGAWMRGHKWETIKKSHALRAYCGSLIAMKFGIYRASHWLRHSTVKVTEGHYTHFLNHRIFRPEEILVRWGRVLM